MGVASYRLLCLLLALQMMHQEVPAKCPALFWTFQTFSLHDQPGVFHYCGRMNRHLLTETLKGSPHSPALLNAVGRELMGQMALLRCHGGHLALRHTGKTLGCVPAGSSILTDSLLVHFPQWIP